MPSFFPSLGYLRQLQHPSLQMLITGSARAIEPNYLIPFSVCSQTYIYSLRIKSFHVSIVEIKQFKEEQVCTSFFLLVDLLPF
jgi:hypothetical protein